MLPGKSWLLLLAYATAACTRSQAAPPAPAPPAPPAAAPAAAARPDIARLHALVINGGGSAEDNFASHVAHVRRLLDHLARVGVGKDRISIFASDGDDPAGDLAVGGGRPDDFWLLEGTPYERALAPATKLVSTALPGHALAPATRPALERWFAGARGRLTAGDTLLVYVTDHGTDNPRDQLDNRITLWGKSSISVRQLRALVERLDPGVRVVMLMSQCFSGGFARLYEVGARNGLPTGNVCGFFSTTHDRPAYGCYPEVAGQDEIGHSFAFFEALAASGRFADAHLGVQVSDDTPDVPLRTSDVYLRDVVAQAARARGLTEDALVDQLLVQAFKNRAPWEPDLRLLDRIGRAFGLPSPRSRKEVAEQARAIDRVRKEIGARGRDWGEVLGDTNNVNCNAALAAHPELAPRLVPRALSRLDEAMRSKLAREWLALVAPLAQSVPVRRERLLAFSQKADLADELGYRMDVRLAVLARMGVILTGVAGRVLLDEPARAGEKTAWSALRACEGLTLPPVPGHKPAAARDPFPGFEDDRRLVESVIPAWMGIKFDDAPPRLRAALGLSTGAAVVVMVMPGSPAQAAGLAPGDLVLGPAGTAFTEPREIKSWTMLAPIGQPQKLDIVRGTERLALTVTPGRHPTEVPQIGPPRPGTSAPPVLGEAVRGSPPRTLLGAGPHLIFFWATWCGPCKESLPDLLAYSDRHKVPIVAVSDQAKDELAAFFATWKAPFPKVVVSDDTRVTSNAYAVSGTPAFVLVDGAGKVKSYTVGYSRDKGLPVPPP